MGDRRVCAQVPLLQLLLGLLLLLTVHVHHAEAIGSLRSNRLLARLTAEPAACQIPDHDQCRFIRDNRDACYPDGGFQTYLVLHYCFFGPVWAWLSLVLLAAAAALAFAVLLTVSERFFCPALELISDYLKLPPVVAGATLLSFGNGAPDTFTQVAAVGQEGGRAVGMALSEPLGGGMFASNVVFGLVVLIASKQQAVIPRVAFLKDVCFYLCSLVIIAFLLADGKVTPVEAAIMCGLYVLYVFATFYTSRSDEPLHADVALHEFPPQDGGIDAHDSGSEDLAFDSDDHPEYIDATTSIREFDLEAPHHTQDHQQAQQQQLKARGQHSFSYMTGSDSSCSSLRSSPSGCDPHRQHRHKQQQAPAAAGAGGSAPNLLQRSGGSSDSGGSRTLQALLSWRQRGAHAAGLKEPLLLAINESPAASRDGTEGAVVGGSNEATSSSGDTAAASRARVEAAAAAAVAAVDCADGQQVEQPAGAAAGAVASPRSMIPEPLLSPTAVSDRMPEPAPQQQGFAGLTGNRPVTPRRSSPASASRGFGAHASRSFTAGAFVSARRSTPGLSRSTSSRGTSTAPPGRADGPDAAGHQQCWSPRAASDSGMLVTGIQCSSCGSVTSPRFTHPVGHPYTLPAADAAAATAAGASPGSGLFVVLPSPHSPLTPRRVTVDGSWGGTGEALLPVGNSPLSPNLSALHQQHFAEQVELLEQQAAEHDALLAAHEEQQEELKAGGMSFKHRLQYPFVQLLSCTMPRVGTGSGHRYNRWRACLLPLTVPLLWFAASPDLLLGVGWRGLALACASAAVGSCIIWATYPASSVPRKTLKGVFAVLTFVQAIVWLNVSASALVQICVVVGVIFGLQPALLGATVLAWGNSVPDVINNMSMAKDGFPSMAVAACFASPLFTLLVGMGGALAYGTALHGGPLTIPVDGPLMVMAGFSIVNTVQHLIVVPLVHRYKMKPSLAVITFLFYGCFSVVYGLTVTGVIHIRALNPPAS